jgi:LacI family transcriptional regulator
VAREPAPKITITEIARLAGVSTGTVSRALNDRERVSPETRAAVLEIVKRTGFVPDVGARRLARGTRQLVSVTPLSVTTIRNPYYAYLLDAIQARLFERGFVARVIDPEDAVASSACAGFIVPGIHLDDASVRALQGRGLPLAVVGRVEGGIPWVDVDNYGGIRAVMDHLFKLGHRRIAHVTGVPIGQVAQTRLDAYRDALQTHAIPFDPKRLLDGGFTELHAYRAVRAALETTPELPFTAIAAASDEMALGAIHALHDLGYRVPHDVSVTGTDDFEFVRSFAPALTTMHQPIGEVGRTASDLLLEALEGAPVRTVVLPTRLVIRGSTSPVVLP